jgi:hypothetical protein
MRMNEGRKDENIKTDCTLKMRKDSPFHHLTSIYIRSGLSTPFPSSICMCCHVHICACVCVGTGGPRSGGNIDKQQREIFEKRRLELLALSKVSR